MDSCSRSEKVVENLYSFETCRTKYGNVSPRNTLAYVGPDRSSDALESATLLKDMQRTHILNAATSPMLSDDEYKYTLRIAPSDAVEMEVIASFLETKAIQYVQVIYIDNAYGMGLKSALMSALEDKDDLCIVNAVGITADNFGAAETMLLNNMVTKYVVLLMDGTSARSVLERVDNDQRLSNE